MDQNEKDQSDHTDQNEKDQSDQRVKNFLDEYKALVDKYQVSIVAFPSFVQTGGDGSTTSFSIQGILATADHKNKDLKRLE